MEQIPSSLSAEYKSLNESVHASLDEFFKVNDCIQPIISLSRDYRNEIDKGISTGWKCLDKILKGFRKNEVTVVTADTGVGKTTFCLNLMFNCAMLNYPVWINSWEMKPEVIMRKLASLVLRKPMKLKRFNDHENEQFDTWCDNYKFYINPKTIGMDVYSLEKELKKLEKLNVKVVLLDHLDYLVNFKREKVHEAIDETMKKLHELAFHHSMHFILICHPRQSMNPNEEIGIHSLKGSSSIKQYADNIITLHRCSRLNSKEDPRKLKLRVVKNRMFGDEGSCYLEYQPDWDGYLEIKQ